MRRIIFAVFLLSLIVHVPAASATAVPPDSLVKGSTSAVYYFANDGKRYVFPNEKTYASWFTSFSAVRRISDAVLADMPIGGNVTYRPGIRMLKIATDPKVYVVLRGAVLRLVADERMAGDLYGPYWNRAIDDVPDVFFTDYSLGAPLQSANDYSPLIVAAGTGMIDEDKGIPPSEAPLRSDTEVVVIIDAWRAFALKSLNDIRAQFGKPPLVENPLLDRIALIHSLDMSLNTKKLQHEGSLGESPDDRIRKGTVPDVIAHVLIQVEHPERFGWDGENIGFIKPVRFDKVDDAIQKLHNAFLDEPADQDNHRTTMLSTFHPFNQVGIGPYLDDSGTFWLTEDFISP